MRPYVLLVVIGILVAGLAALAVRKVAPPPASEQVVAAQTVKILIAQDTIPAGSFVRADSQLSWGEWPVEQAKSPPYIAEAGGVSAESFNGAVARRTIFAGEPITQSSVVKPGEGGFMSAVLGAGKRAVSIPVNATTGNAGFIFPGDAVDLILTHSIQRGESEGEGFASETFVEDVRVLAVDQMLDNPENKAVLAKTVTLEVAPQQAEAITVALEMGKISISLRSLAADGETPADSTISQPVELHSPYDGITTSDEVTRTVPPAPTAPGVDYFYPDNVDDTDGRHYTRDSDISKLIGGSDGTTRKVRVIRGKESSDLVFPQERK